MTDASTNWRRLRLKPDPTADDHDWATNLVTPNRLTAVVGGTTTAGVYSITVQGKVFTRTGGTLTVDFTATMTRAAETDAQIADALEDDFDAGTITTTSPITLASVGITADVSSATITMLFPPNCDLTITTSAPGSATITLPLGSTMPITASAPLYGRAGTSSPNGVICMVQLFDDVAGTIPLAPAGTFSLQLVELAEIESVDSRGDRTYRYITGVTTSLTGQTCATPIELPVRGAKYWTVRIHTDSGTFTSGTESLEVVWRPSAT